MSILSFLLYWITSRDAENVAKLHAYPFFFICFVENHLQRPGNCSEIACTDIDFLHLV